MLWMLTINSSEDTYLFSLFFSQAQLWIAMLLPFVSILGHCTGRQTDEGHPLLGIYFSL